jgi:hypothetical protein
MRTALINGAVGAVGTLDGEPYSVGGITVRGRKIVAIDILADPERLRQIDLTILDNWLWATGAGGWVVAHGLGRRHSPAAREFSAAS